MQEINELKLVLRENSSEFFSEEELSYYLNKNDNDFNKTVYELANLKAQNCNLNLGSGLSFTDDPSIYLKIAKNHRTNGSRCL